MRREFKMIAKNDRKWRKTLPCYTHLESAKTGLDSTSSQGAQDLNDLLGLLKGAVFVRGQWRNLRQQHQDRWWFLRTCYQAWMDHEWAKMWITFLWKLHTTVSKLWRGSPDVRDATHGRRSTREPLRFNHDPINFPISMLSSLLQSCTNFPKSMLFQKICIINPKSQKDLFEMHASLGGTNQHHDSTHGKWGVQVKLLSTTEKKRRVFSEHPCPKHFFSNTWST